VTLFSHPVFVRGHDLMDIPGSGRTPEEETAFMISDAEQAVERLTELIAEMSHQAGLLGGELMDTVAAISALTEVPVMRITISNG
jgi:hypothetical protein